MILFERNENRFNRQTCLSSHLNVVLENLRQIPAHILLLPFPVWYPTDALTLLFSRKEWSGSEER